MSDDVKTTGGRGFAGMAPEKRRAIAVAGGKGVPKEKRAFASTPGLAADAGRKGGSAPRAKRKGKGAA